MIRIVVQSRIRRLAERDEDIELETPAEWDLSRALDMCHRIDALINSRGNSQQEESGRG